MSTRKVTNVGAHDFMVCSVDYCERLAVGPGVVEIKEWRAARMIQQAGSWEQHRVHGLHTWPSLSSADHRRRSGSSMPTRYPA
jgi:hypothetical protein